MAKTIAVIGAFDTKAREYAFLRELIVARVSRRTKSGCDIGSVLHDQSRCR